MQNRLFNNFKNLLFPSLTFSVITGALSAIIVTAFKILAEMAVHISAFAYGFVRENPSFLPILALSAAALGLLSSLVFSLSHTCRGGGIPTSIVAIRCIVAFKWYLSLCFLPICALISFISGLPLGTEGPCVQMGTAVGDGVVRSIGGKKYKSWRRYTMTGGAAAGFSIVTASPITAIIFSMEELHKHFSPMLLTTAALSVASAQITARGLEALGFGTLGLFTLPDIPALPPILLFAPLCVGIICGLASILFTRFYHIVDKLISAALKKTSVRIIFPALFTLTAIVGFFLTDSLGSGHSLIESLLHGRVVFYILILVLLIRVVGMCVYNTAGTTGGVFLPTLAFGAVIGSLCGQALVALGWIGDEHQTLMVVLGITSFLGATSRIPLTACVFALEALSATSNVLSVVIATGVALIIVELSGIEDFTDTLISAKIRKIKDGKTARVITARLIAAEGSFVIGKEMRDVLWPNSCFVAAFDRADKNRKSHSEIGVGDVITLLYKTYSPEETAEEIFALVGTQSDEVVKNMISEADTK